MELAELKQLIQTKEKEGKICFMTCEGLMQVDTDKFCEQSTEGILYDLNRDKATILTNATEDNLRWINDYAVAVVIKHLKDGKRD